MVTLGGSWHPESTCFLYLHSPGLEPNTRPRSPTGDDGPVALFHAACRKKTRPPSQLTNSLADRKQDRLAEKLGQCAGIERQPPQINRFRHSVFTFFEVDRHLHTNKW